MSNDSDFERRWQYRATINSDVVAEAEHASDITACQWATQVVWPSLKHRPTKHALVVERQNMSGEWQFVEQFWRMRVADESAT